MTLRSRFFTLLRDPIWQLIGVLVAIVGLWGTTASTSKANAELAIYHYQKINFNEYLLPTDRIRMVLIGSNEELSRAVVDYYVITNRSDKAIVASDFTSPITLLQGSQTKKLFLVATCSTSPGDPKNTGSATRVAINWTQSGEKWAAQPALLNPGDYSCVTVISQEAETSTKATAPHDRFEWDSRIVNVKLRTFDSTEDYAKTLKYDWSDYLGAEINMSGYTPYWFAVLQLLLFFGTATLARGAGWVSTIAPTDLLKIAGIMLLATGSAESLTSIFTYARLSTLHPAVGLFLILHIVIVLVMNRSAKKRNRAMPLESADFCPGNVTVLTSPGET